MASRFWSLSNSLAMLGHPITPQGRDGGPSMVRSLAVVFDPQRQLFQAIFLSDGLDANRLEQDITRAGYHLYTVLPLPPVSDPDPGSYTPAVPRTATPAAAEPARQRPAATRKSRKAVDARARAEEAVELLRQLLVL